MTVQDTLGHFCDLSGKCFVSLFFPLVEIILPSPLLPLIFPWIVSLFSSRWTWGGLKQVFLVNTCTLGTCWRGMPWRGFGRPRGAHVAGCGVRHCLTVHRYQRSLRPYPDPSVLQAVDRFFYSVFYFQRFIAEEPRGKCRLTPQDTEGQTLGVSGLARNPSGPSKEVRASHGQTGPG